VGLTFKYGNISHTINSMSDSIPSTRSDLVRQQALVAARPLIAWLVRAGVGHADFAAALKPLFLELAREELSGHRQRINDSALSLRSGLHRKDVRALSRPADADRVEEGTAPATGRPTPSQQLITRWITGGLPHTLPLSGERSFETLAQGTTRDLHPRALLDELVRLAVVTVDAGQVTLCRQAFVPDSQSSDAARLLADSVADHAAAAVHNVSGPPGRRYLDQSVFADGLSEASAQELERLANQLWSDVLKSMVGAAQPLCENDEPLGATHRIRLGMYCYVADTAVKKEETP
jgi:Family of unknown function (DUF6502)